MIQIFRPGRAIVIPGIGVTVASVRSSAGTGALLANLISFWELGEASGTRNDSHGTNHLTDNGTVGQAVGKVGNAAQFDIASGRYLSIADNSSLSIGDIDFTLALWCYFDSISTNTSSGNFRALAGKITVLSATHEYGLYQANSAIRFEVDSAASVDGRVISTTTVTTGTWYFVVGYHDAANNLLKLIINDGTPDQLSFSGGVRDSTLQFTIGGRNAGGFYHGGRIDQVGLWKRVLTPIEITWLYNSGNGRSYAEIAAY